MPVWKLKMQYNFYDKIITNLVTTENEFQGEDTDMHIKTSHQQQKHGDWGQAITSCALSAAIGLGHCTCQIPWHEGKINVVKYTWIKVK